MSNILLEDIIYPKVFLLSAQTLPVSTALCLCLTHMAYAGISPVVFTESCNLAWQHLMNISTSLEICKYTLSFTEWQSAAEDLTRWDSHLNNLFSNSGWREKGTHHMNSALSFIFSPHKPAPYWCKAIKVPDVDNVEWIWRWTQPCQEHTVWIAAWRLCRVILPKHHRSSMSSL